MDVGAHRGGHLNGHGQAVSNWPRNPSSVYTAIHGNLYRITWRKCQGSTALKYLVLQGSHAGRICVGLHPVDAQLSIRRIEAKASLPVHSRASVYG
jgi:hypothetical protein